MNFSIIIPIYNSDYIEKQLFSINNLYKENISFEVIFVDDWSDLEHKEIYKKYFSNYTNLEMVYYYLWEKFWKNRVSEARNKWVFLSKSENLVFIDQETILPVNYLIKLKEFFNSNEVIIWPYFWYNNLKKEINDEIIEKFIKNWTLEDKNFKDFRVPFYKEKEKKWNIWEFFWASNFVIKKDIFLKVWWFDESITTWWDEDVDIWYRLFKLWYKIIFREDMQVLNLSKKLYNEPYNILEKGKIKELSENWFNNLKKHKSKEYVNYVFDRYSNLPKNYNDLVFVELKKLFEKWKKIF